MIGRIARSCLALLPLAVGRAAAQDAADLTYVIMRAGQEIGREHVVARGTTLQFDARRPGAQEELRATLGRAGDGPQVESLQLEIRRAEGGTTVRAANRGGRVFISTVGDGARGGRELPGGAGVVFLDESLVTLLLAVAPLATEEGARLVGVHPRTGQRVPFTAMRRTAGGRTEIGLSGGLAGRLVLGADGQVELVELTRENLTARRIPS